VVFGGVDGAGEGDAEGDGLAGASLGEADEVVAGEEAGKCGGLDGRWRRIAKGCDGLERGVIDAERGERPGDGGFGRGEVRIRARRRGLVGAGGVGATSAASAAPTTLWCERFVRRLVGRLLAVNVVVVGWGRAMGRWPGRCGCDG